MAALRQRARLLRLHVGPSRQEAAVHGPGVRPDLANGIATPTCRGGCSTIRPHQGLKRLIGDLNAFYRARPALHARDCEPEGFRWIVVNDADQSVLALLRFGAEGDAPVAVIVNFTPVVRRDYRIGLPKAGRWREAINTDAAEYGGSGVGNLGGVVAEAHALARPAGLGAARRCRRWRLCSWNGGRRRLISLDAKPQNPSSIRYEPGALREPGSVGR